MLEYDESKIVLDINRTEKKEWEQPQIAQLNVRETKSSVIGTQIEFFFGDRDASN